MTETAPQPGAGPSARPPGPGSAPARDGQRAGVPAHRTGGPSPREDVAPSGECTTQRRGRGWDPAIMATRGARVVRWGGPQGRPRWTVTLDGDRSAALLVRVWLEDGPRSFRGRLTSIDTSPGRPGADEATVALAASPREVVDAVRAWLDEFLGDASNSIDSGE